MKHKVVLLWPLLIAFICVLCLSSSCNDDASKVEESNCPEDEALCDGVCVRLDTKAHCGACHQQCSFDRVCSAIGSGSYQCECPQGKTSCGSDLSCSWLDGGIKDARQNDPRCGDCHTICVETETCKDKGCICMNDTGEILSDTDGKPLSGEALSEEYLRNDDNCGFCGNVCAGIGEHCVLGQCTKTQCSEAKDGLEECHFTLADGREECQPCDQLCKPMSSLTLAQHTPLMPMIGKGQNARLNEQNTNRNAYEYSNAGFVFKRVLGCTCDKEAGQTCFAGTSDRCDGTTCVCGHDSSICVVGTACTSAGCKTPCDELGRACAGKAECNKGQCQCAGVLAQGDPLNPKMAHCIDGLACAGGKCYCSTSGGKNIECGVLGDRCSNGSCVCGEQGTVACQGDAICKFGACICGKSGVCDLQRNPSCVDGKCVCGTAGKAKTCQANEICKNNLCQCPNNDACKQYGKIDTQGRGQADWCKDGVCVCGSTGTPCPSSRVCVNGQCLCTNDSDCPINETCDMASGQCTCGGANSCAVGSSCTDAGFCSCKLGKDCNHSEVCKNIPGLGEICVCDAKFQQKACKLGAKCKRGIALLNNDNCVVEDPKACYDDEKLRMNFCVCGASNRSCAPGEHCKGSQCL